MEGSLGDSVIRPSHDPLGIQQHAQQQMTHLEPATIQDSNGNTTSANVAIKHEPVDRSAGTENPGVEQEGSPTMERICNISGEAVELNPSGSTQTMLVAGSRQGEIPIIVPSGKAIFLSDQFTAVLIRPESLLYGMEVPVIKKETSGSGQSEHVIVPVSEEQSSSAVPIAVSTAESSSVQVPWFLQVGNVTSAPGETGAKDIVEPLMTAPDAASATPKTPYMFTSKDRTFTCEFCPNITFTRGQLRKHKTVHTGQRNYVCGVCSKRFAVKHSLVKHMVLHSGQNPFTCEQCGKSFSTAYHLQHHVRSHDPERQYKCSQCDKMFAKPDHLAVHVRTHSGEETYPCGDCGKSFTTKLGLNTHERVHAGVVVSGGTAFGCALCGIQVPTYGDLVSHAKTHGDQEQAAMGATHGECVVMTDGNDSNRTDVVPTTIVSTESIAMPVVVTSVNGVGTA